MLIPTQNRKKIHQYLFKEGVVVIKKDFHLAQHPEIPVPNLQVIKALQSLMSKGYVSQTFSWQYYYYILNEQGVELLRKELGLPQTVVPATIAKALKAPVQEDRQPRRDNRDDGYRRRNDDEKKLGASSDFKPSFRGGFSRNRPSVAN